MNKLVIVFLCLVLGVFVSTGITADNEVTLKGNVICARCALKMVEGKKCEMALQVKNGDKTENYFMAANDLRRQWENDLWEKDKINWCEVPTAVTAVGTMKEENGKKIFTATKLTKTEKLKKPKKAIKTI